jgi:putative membrane protein
MLEHMLIGYVVPPLLLNGMSRWMAEATFGRVAPWMRHLAHPVVGFFAFNITIVAIHWPRAIEVQNTTEGLHFAAHVAMFVAGMLMWLPVYSPTPRLPRLNEPMQMLYLFLNTIIPTVPASFITFSHTPLYPVYGNGPARWGLSLIADQTIGGVVMKLGGGFYLLGIILSIWVRYTREERRWDVIERDLANKAS